MKALECVAIRILWIFFHRDKSHQVDWTRSLKNFFERYSKWFLFEKLYNFTIFLRIILKQIDPIISTKYLPVYVIFQIPLLREALMLFFDSLYFRERGEIFSRKTMSSPRRLQSRINFGSNEFFSIASSLGRMTCCPAAITWTTGRPPLSTFLGHRGRKQESESERKSGEEPRGGGEKRGGGKRGGGAGGGGGWRGRVNPLLIFRVTLSTGSESPATGDFQTTASEEKKMRRPATRRCTFA